MIELDENFNPEDIWGPVEPIDYMKLQRELHERLMDLGDLWKEHQDFDKSEGR